MKRTLKTIAVSLIAAMIMSLAACSQPAVNTNTETSVVSENTSVLSEVTTPESSVSESETQSAISDTSKVESITESSVSSKAESSEQSKTEQSQQSKPTTSKPTTSNNTQNSKPTSTTGKPVETSQVSKPTTNNTQTSKPTSSNTSSNQTSKPSETSQTSKPATSNSTQTSKPATSNTQTSKPTETSQVSKPSTPTTKPTTKPSTPTTKPSTGTTTPKVPVKDITPDSKGAILAVGQKYKIKYSVYPENADVGKITWSSDNPDAISISSDGTLTAKKPYEHAEITVKTSNGVKSYCGVSTISGSQEKADKLISAYQAPYEGKTKGWQETVIADLRELGEKKYNMTWDDSLYVSPDGEGGGWRFPAANTDSYNGAGFRQHCMSLFSDLEKESIENGDDMSYAHFKVVIEDKGNLDFNKRTFWVYLIFG